MSVPLVSDQVLVPGAVIDGAMTSRFLVLVTHVHITARKTLSDNEQSVPLNSDDARNDVLERASLRPSAFWGGRADEIQMPSAAMIG